MPCRLLALSLADLCLAIDDGRLKVRREGSEFAVERRELVRLLNRQLVSHFRKVA